MHALALRTRAGLTNLARSLCIRAASATGDDVVRVWDALPRGAQAVPALKRRRETGLQARSRSGLVCAVRRLRAVDPRV